MTVGAVTNSSIALSTHLTDASFSDLVTSYTATYSDGVITKTTTSSDGSFDVTDLSSNTAYVITVKSNLDYYGRTKSSTAVSQKTGLQEFLSFDWLAKVTCKSFAFTSASH